MRHLTAADLEVLASPHYTVHTRVLVTDADGLERDLSDLGGIDWIAGADWGKDIDQPIVQPRIQLRREVEGTNLSLSPFDEWSPLNYDADDVFRPLIDAGRRIRLFTATVPPGVDPGPGDWREVFDGEIDDVEWQTDPMLVLCRDPGGILQDTIIEDPQQYGSEAGVLLHVVMQQLLDDVLGAGVETLHIPEAPGFMVTGYQPDEGPLMDALGALAGAIGWDVRYLWDESSQAFQLTLIRPDREKTEPDYEFGPDQYIDVNRLAVSRADVRNVVQVVYPDRISGQQERVTVQDNDSIERYRRRFMRITEREDSPIDTGAEADALAQAALSDLAEPKAEQEIELRYWWPAELGDLYRFKANGVHYTTDQTLAVVGIRHRLTEGQQRTVLICRGRPAGGYLRWLKRGRRRPEATAVLYAECQARIVESDAGTVTIQVDAVPEAGEIRLINLVGATIIDGPDLDEPVDATAPAAERTWVFARPQYGAGIGEAVFRAEIPGYEPDDDHVTITEVGRDTIPLTLRVRQAPVQQNPLAPVFRVSVGDPRWDEISTDVTITYQLEGVPNVQPPGTQTIPAALIRATPDETEAEGGYIDYVITRPAAGSGSGRVTFLARRGATRSTDVDAVDVPELPADVEEALPPRATIQLAAIVGTDGIFHVSGTRADGGTSGLQYRVVWWPEDEPQPVWPAYQPLSAFPTIVPVPGSARWATRVAVQVRDTSNGRESNPATAVLPAHDLITGGTIQARGLTDQGFTGLVGGGGGTFRPAAALVAQAESPSQNLLGPDAGAAYKRMTAGLSGPLHEVTIAEIRVAPGAPVSASCTVAPDSGVSAQGRIELYWRDASNAVVQSDTGTYVSGGRTKIEGVTVPASAVMVEVRVRTDAAGVVGFSDFMLNPGPLASGFTEPPLRANRGREGWAYKSFDGERVLGEGVTQRSAGVQRAIAKGYVRGQGYKDTEQVPFEESFESPPDVRIEGGIFNEPRAARWSGPYDPTLPVAGLTRAINVTPTGFDILAKLVQYGVRTKHTHLYGGNPLTTVDASRSVAAANAPASDGRFVITLDVTVHATTPGFDPIVSADLVVEIATNDGTGWEPRATRLYAVSGPPVATRNWLNDKIPIDVDLDPGDDIRVRIKSFVASPEGSFSVTPKQVEYHTSTDAEATRTPDDYTVDWVALEVSE